MFKQICATSLNSKTLAILIWQQPDWVITVWLGKQQQQVHYKKQIVLPQDRFTYMKVAINPWVDMDKQIRRD